MPGRGVVSQAVCLHVDDDLIPVVGCAAIEVGSQGALGDETERVGPALAHRDLGLVVGVVIEPVGCGFQRALHDRPDLWRQSTTHHQHAIVIDPDLEMPALVTSPVVLSRGDSVDVSPGAHQPFDVVANWMRAASSAMASPRTAVSAWRRNPAALSGRSIGVRSSWLS